VTSYQRTSVSGLCTGVVGRKELGNAVGSQLHRARTEFTNRAAKVNAFVFSMMLSDSIHLYEPITLCKFRQSIYKLNHNKLNCSSYE
jgi:hypothetical protein